MTDQPLPATDAAAAEALQSIEPAHNGHWPLIDMPLPATEAHDYTSALAKLSVQLDRADRRITVRGELDIASVPVLGHAMALLIDLDPGDTTIDLADTRFIDAAGLGCLVDFANQLAACGAKITVVGASPRLRRVFELVQLDGLLQAS